MSVRIEFRIRVDALLRYVENEFGSLEGLEAYLDRHPGDSARVLLYEAVMRHRKTPRKVLTFGRAYLGGTRRGPFSVAKLDLLEYLMSRPGASIRQAARDTGLDPATIHQHVRELRRMGLVMLRREGGRGPASIEVLPRQIDVRLVKEPAGAEA